MQLEATQEATEKTSQQVNQANTYNTSLTLAKLRWQCRRGMLELDMLLGLFLEQVYLKLTPLEQKLFGDLLKFPDPTLHHWLLGGENPKLFAQASNQTEKTSYETLWPIIQKIRNHQIIEHASG